MARIGFMDYHNSVLNVSERIPQRRGSAETLAKPQNDHQDEDDDGDNDDDDCEQTSSKYTLDKQEEKEDSQYEDMEEFDGKKIRGIERDFDDVLAKGKTDLSVNQMEILSPGVHLLSCPPYLHLSSHPHRHHSHQYQAVEGSSVLSSSSVVEVSPDEFNADKSCFCSSASSSSPSSPCVSIPTLDYIEEDLHKDPSVAHRSICTSSNSSILFCSPLNASGSSLSEIDEKKHQMQLDRNTDLSFQQLFAFSASCLGRGIFAATLSTYTMPFYTDYLYVPLREASVITAIILVLYALPQPIFGWIQDGKLTRYGRRKPWLAVSLVLMTVSTFAILCPPGTDPTFVRVWGTLWAFLIGPSWGCVDTTTDAIGAEITFSYIERTRLQAVVCGSFITGVLLSGILYGSFATTFGADLHSIRLRLLVLASVGATATLVGGLVTLLYVSDKMPLDAHLANEDRYADLQLTPIPEEGGGDGIKESVKGEGDGPVGEWRPYAHSRVEGKWRRRWTQFARSGHILWLRVQDMLQNKPAMLLLGINALGLAGLVITTFLMPYFSKHVVESEFCINWAPSFISIFSIVCLPPWICLSSTIRYFEKRYFYFLTGWWISGFLIVTALAVKQGQGVVFMTLTAVGLGIGFAGFFVVGASMKPDVVDYDEFRCGARREGRYMGMFLFVSKITAGIGLVVAMQILDAAGYSTTKGMEHTFPSEKSKSILALRLLYGFCFTICTSVASALLYFYPITSNKHKIILEATIHRLHGGFAVDPIYGGHELPPYDKTFLNCSVAKPTIRSIKSTSTMCSSESEHSGWKHLGGSSEAAARG